MRSILALVSLSLAIVFLPSAHSETICSKDAVCDCSPDKPNPKPNPRTGETVCPAPCTCYDLLVKRS
ncbi:hypothetical protein PGT21_006236 [Puccinia graminis f. sp. tritici]|uniref:Uncharacterized protein n=1 Tax=Puccinia graminis f. sp. tritici TaxID=56615 RepID=A0A5B0PVL7_PUCGR|nr:hypothetical protein PGT21_006236 [Puccinia graminis f. sp. tritici]KAA1104902.1 hypothetical protein PGTUg99_008666 [Puccinia graminis f. sp. tritici]